jgi:hypothetical protein
MINMEKKRYAFLVENEIFHIMPIAGNYEDRVFLRWSNGFLNEPTGLDISGIPNIAIGSIWNGESFDNSHLPEDSIILEANSNQKRYAFIDKENVVFMILDLTDSLSLLKDAFAAAFSTGEVTAMDITSFSENVSYWWAWDGESFSPPVES